MPALLARGNKSHLAKLVRQFGADALGRSVIAHTTPLGENARDEALPGIEIAKATGQFVARLLSTTRRAASVSRVAIRPAGPCARSTSGVCRSSGTSRRGLRSAARIPAIRNLDGIEVMLKGGQMGPPDLFHRLRCGTFNV